jgi:hypothetical protein
MGHLVGELKYRDTHTHAQLGDLSFWKEFRARKAFMSIHSIDRK